MSDSLFGNLAKTTGAAKQDLIEGYDRSMASPLLGAYYGHSDYFNYGYWEPGIQDQAAASDNLVAKLLEMIPEKTGKILDVACGRGASTRHLLRYYEPTEITATNISSNQLERAAQIARGCTLRVMDAASMDFPDESFDNLLCVEAAFHFDTRDGFYREALRVLKPGGRLVTSDILGPRGSQRIIPANTVLTPGELRDHLYRAGFEKVQVTDATEQCWKSFRRHLVAWPAIERREGRLDLSSYLSMMVIARAYATFVSMGISHYLLTCAKKPS
jgi:MPBQ/MSBQ methyltransferase